MGRLAFQNESNIMEIREPMSKLVPTHRAVWLYTSIIGFGACLIVLLVRNARVGLSGRDWILYFLGYYLTWTVLSAFFHTDQRRTYTIDISDVSVSGPSASGRQRITIPFNRIDIARTTRQGVFHKLLGLRSIWSVGGERILVNLAFFPKATGQDLLQRIGCAELLH